VVAPSVSSIPLAYLGISDDVNTHVNRVTVGVQCTA